MEVIARRYPRKRQFITILIASASLILIGAGLLVASGMVVNFPDALDYIAFGLIVIGIACTGMMVFTLVRYCRLPEILISYENGVFTFPKGVQCRASEISDINYNEAKPYYKDVSYDFGFGLIKLTVNGKQIKVYYVAGAANACERLKTLVREDRLKGE